VRSSSRSAHTYWPTSAGYFGADGTAIQVREQNFMGRVVTVFTSSHERSHIMGAYGMSPFPQGQPVYCLVWEGTLGDFYEVDRDVNVRHLGRVMAFPGLKYRYLFALADPTGQRFTDVLPRHADAGKLMALAAYSDRGPASTDEQAIIDFLLDYDSSGGDVFLQPTKEALSWCPFVDVGVESPAFKNLAGKFSDALFNRFLGFASDHLTKGYPLLIVGGCGLNCEWNSRWQSSRLFADVFVPPCANDSGSAIGTAVDAQHYCTGNAKIAWSVYAGDEFWDDVADGPPDFEVCDAEPGRVAAALAQGHVVAWVQGRCEIGPRALGNRSLFAAPFDPLMTARLNGIKSRESYRPIAPVCLEEDAEALFARRGPSPYMLFFNEVRDPRLRAITHVDGTARVQTVNRTQNSRLYELLRHFKRLTGYGVLCNTSLNFSGRGFINRASDLVEYCRARKVDHFVIHDRLFSRSR
jgi:hydroxymethyl cephem carbamoyltransferase